jgi:hypothetical protein
VENVLETDQVHVYGLTPAAGSVSFTVTATDSAATPKTETKTYMFEIQGVGAPPVIYAIVTGTLGNEEWYISDVLVHWVIQEDKPLTVQNPCPDVTITTDTTELGQAVTCTATSADGTVTVPITIKRDATAPINVIGTPDRDPDQGWYTAPVTFTFEGEDPIPGSGLDSCPSVLYDGPGGKDIQIQSSCFDVAGNETKSAPYLINYDASGPVVTVKFDPEANNNGWFNEPVDISLDVVDAGFGADLATCKMTITIAELADPVVVDGTSYHYAGPDSSEDIKVIGECSDLPGNVGISEETLFKYDNTAPIDVTGAPVRVPDNHGGSDDLDWYNDGVDVEFTGTDPVPGSGLDDCTTVTYAGPDGLNVTVPGKCWDFAGNASAEVASSAFNYDNTDPTVDFELYSGKPVYLHQPVETIMNASDNLSGIDLTRSSCEQADASTIGAKTLDCILHDNAGNGPVDGTAAYNVIYKFNGFFRPAGEGWNEVNAGRTLSIKWHLADYYDVDQDGAAVSFVVTPVICDVEGLEPFEAPAGIVEDMQPQKHGSYHFNWKTEKDQTGCAQVLIDLGEGLSDTVYPEYAHSFNVMWK